ncbi:hypothetical protein [Amycolatopsis sp. NPDC004378]
MTTITRPRSLTRAGARAGAAALAVAAFTAGAATASASPGSPAGVEQAAPAHAVVHAAAERAAAVNTVKVTDALLRSEPNTTSTKLDVSQPGRVVDLYCWVQNPPTGAYYIWFKAHPQGSKYTGWMRADLINWATYPSPGRC